MTASPELDTDFVRGQFPAFSEPSLEGWAFFENAGGSFPCWQVLERLVSYYRRSRIQPYYPNPISEAAGAAMDESYRRLAGYLDVAEDEVHFGPSTSQNTYVLARALRDLWEEGDEIVVTNQDHEANAGVWRRLAAEGLVVREWQVDSATGRLAIDGLDRCLGPKTRMIAFPHCSNVVGEINPVADIAERARELGAITVVDGVSYAPHGLPNVAALGADIYLFSAYKTWGPHLGVMTVRRDLLDEMTNQSHFFNADDPRKKLLPAGPDHGQIAAAAGIAEYLDAVDDHHFEEPAEEAERGRRVAALFQAHEHRLLARLLDWLAAREDVHVLGPRDAAGRAPTVSILPRERPISEILPVLVEHRILAGSGHFYGVRALEAMGIAVDPGVLRLSFLHYTVESEIDRLIEALEAALEPSAARSGRPALP